MQEKSLLKKKILQFVDFKGISKADFYKKTGITRGVLDQNNGLTEDNLARFIASFPEVSVEWLVAGSGEMIKNDSNQANPSSVVKSMPSNSLDNDPRNLLTKTIPYYGDVDVTAGPDVLFTDSGAVPTDYIHIPSFQDCDIAFPIYGDSMWPVYQPGHVVLCKEFNDWRDYVPFGEVFLIVTDNLRTVKYVKKATREENLLLVSENKHFEPFELPKSQIRRMFFVKGAIKRNMI